MTFFTNPSLVIYNWCWEMIQDYKLVTKYNIPLGASLESLSVFKVDCFSIIEHEIENINNHRKEHG